MSDADFLHTLTPAERDALEDMGEPGTYAAGSVIFEQGGTPDCILLVRGGRVRPVALSMDIADDAGLSRATRQESSPLQKSEAMPLFSQSP